LEGVHPDYAIIRINEAHRMPLKEKRKLCKQINGKIRQFIAAPSFEY
jgi:hypothetical protein